MVFAISLQIHDYSIDNPCEVEMTCSSQWLPDPTLHRQRE